MAAPERTKFCGALSYQPRWGLTRRGLAYLAACVLVLGILFVATVHPFLAITEKVNASILVVEGWNGPATIRDTAEEFRKGGYSHLYVTGGPIEGNAIGEYSSYAEQGYVRLQRYGISTNVMTAVVSPLVRKDRSYTAALALHQYFRTNGMNVSALNLMTGSTHARRSWLVTRKAFGEETRIGVISAPPTEYPVNRWWRYSSGVREVLDETIAYIYARFFFWPKPG